MSPLSIRFGGYQKPASIHHRAAARFGELLHARLGERIAFELVGNVLDLGRESGELPAMVAAGELALCYISTVRFAGPVPEWKVLELPFVVHDRDAVQRAFTGAFGDLLKRRMAAATPFRLLGVWDNGFRHVTNKVRPIHTPADCRGLRIRTQVSELHVEALAAMGFVPIPVDVKEFVEKAAGDTFDAQENPLTNTWNFGVHRLHRHITLSGHLFGATAMICNEAIFRAWPRDVQDAVEEAASEATAFQLQLAAAEDDAILAQLDPVQNDVVRLSAQEHGRFVDAVAPMLARHRRELDPTLFRLLAH